MCMLVVERTLKLSHRFIVDVRKKFLQFFSSLGWMVMGMKYSWHAVYYILHISFQSWKVTIIILLLLFYSTFVIITQVALMIYPIKYNFNSLPQCKSPHSSVVRVSNHCICGRSWIPFLPGVENCKNIFPFPFWCLFFPVSVPNSQSLQCLKSHFSSAKIDKSLSCKHWPPRVHLVI